MKDKTKPRGHLPRDFGYLELERGKFEALSICSYPADIKAASSVPSKLGNSCN